MSITTAQIRGARGILNWSQQDLAQQTDISATSIGAIESGSTTPRGSTLEKIRTAFERNGIEFLGLEGIRKQSDYIRTYSGKDGFKEFMDYLYETAKNTGGEIVLFNAHPPHWYKWLGKEWFEAHAKRMHDLGSKINVRITAKSGETNLISSEFAEYRWFPEDMFNDRAVYAFGDNVAFVNFEEDDLTVSLIQHASFADAFRVLFNIAWNNVAKVPQAKVKSV